MSVHNMAATIFVVATILHLTLNWNAFLKYMVEKTTEYLTFKREMLISLVAVIVVIGIFSSHALHIHHP